jgi:hypothetical protein
MKYKLFYLKLIKLRTAELEEAMLKDDRIRESLLVLKLSEAHSGYVSAMLETYSRELTEDEIDSELKRQGNEYTIADILGTAKDEKIFGDAGTTFNNPKLTA